MASASMQFGEEDCKKVLARNSGKDLAAQNNMSYFDLKHYQ
jgi:hypothetical protein